MEAYPPEEVRDAAETIRPLLPKLLDAETAAWVDQDLADLLARAGAGEAVDHDIERLLGRREPTRDWVRFYLARFRADEEPVRGDYAAPPGHMSAVPAQQYACPGEACVVRWRCRATGQRVPICPAHGAELVPLAQ